MNALYLVRHIAAALVTLVGYPLTMGSELEGRLLDSKK